MKNLTQIADELRGLLSDIEKIIGQSEEDVYISDTYGIDGINLSSQHASETFTISDTYDDFQIVLDTPKKD